MPISKTSQSTKHTTSSMDIDDNDIIDDLEIAELIDHQLYVNLITYDEYQNGE